MEAKVLAATGLLAEGVALKQALQFLLGCKEHPGDNVEVEMKLYLDSTSAQAFFQRLGRGQEAMRRGWFKIGRIPTKENPADLNTKALSKERREYLAQLIGLCSESFQPLSTPSVQRIVQMLVAAGWLKGCAPEGDNCEGMRSTVRQSMWCILLLVTTVLFLLFVMSVMVFNIQKIRASLSRYRIAWKEIRAELNLRRSEDPMRIAGDADTENEGEEEEADDEADDNGDEPDDDGNGDDHDPGGGENPWYTDVPVTGSSSTTYKERHSQTKEEDCTEVKW